MIPLPAIVEIWQAIPVRIQAFIIGPSFFLFLGYCLFLFKKKTTQTEMLEEKWDAAKSMAVRDDNDRKSRRIDDLENAQIKIRKEYEDFISTMTMRHNKEIDDLKANRMMGWDIARAWCDKSHTLSHYINGLLQVLPDDRRPTRAPPDIPEFENIVRVGEADMNSKTYYVKGPEK